MSVKVNVYLSFGGNCKEAFAHYEKVFRTPLAYSCSYGEQEEMGHVKEEDKGKILHCALPLADATMLMGSDIVQGNSEPSVVTGNNVTMSIDPDSEDEAKRLYAELSEGGKVIVPLEKSFWNSLYAIITDKFGINWMINYSYENCI